MSEVIP